MLSTNASIEIAATPDQVWALAGGFTSLKDWQPALLKCEAAEGGRVRHIALESGEVIVERLESFDDRQRTYSYSLVESPFPARDYLSTIRISAHGDKGSLVAWSGTFTAVGASDDEVIALFKKIYEGGLAALKQQFPG